MKFCAKSGKIRGRGRDVRNSGAVLLMPEAAMMVLVIIMPSLTSFIFSKVALIMST